MADEQGVVFPSGPDGRRSTAALGRGVVADALRPVDPAGALAAEQETNWRAGYLVHFRRLVEAGLASRAAALTIAGAGLDAVHGRLRVAGDGDEQPLATLLSAPAGRTLATREVTGQAEPERGFSLPFRGARLRGDDLQRRLDTWGERPPAPRRRGGPRVPGVAPPRPDLWRRVLDTARRGAGTLLVPTGDGATD